MVTEKGATDIGMVAVGGLYHAGAVRGAVGVTPIVAVVEVDEEYDEEYSGLVEVVGRGGDVTLADGRDAGDGGENAGVEGVGGVLGLTEGVGCPACETSGDDLECCGGADEGTGGVGDVAPLVMEGEFGTVEGGLLSVDDNIGTLGLLCDRGFVDEDGVGGDGGGVLGLLCGRFLRDSDGLGIGSGEIRGEELEL